MKKNLISIIIPVYNVENYLKQCLDSIINQTYKNLEIIIIDDWSTDNSWKICDEYAKNDKRIKVIHQKNADLSAARNSWLKIATWEYIGYIDSDDFIELNMYEKLYNLIESTESDLAICNRYIGKKDWSRTKNAKFPSRQIITPNEALEIFYKHMYVRNKLYKAEIIKDLKFIETYAQDVLYNFTIFKKIKKICCLNECMNYYRYNPNSRQHTKRFRENRYIYLNEWINQEISYAEKNKLHTLKTDLINARSEIILKWLSFLALDKNPSTSDVNKLSKIVKKNLRTFLKSKWKFFVKCFAISVCINFKTASKIYQFINKIRL